MDGGAWLGYLSAAALAMLLVGTERLWLCIALCAIAAFIVICLQTLVPDNTGLLSDKSLFLGNFVFNVLVIVPLIFVIVYHAVRQIARAEAAAEREFQRSEELLANILPRDVAERLPRPRRAPLSYSPTTIAPASPLTATPPDGAAKIIKAEMCVQAIEAILIIFQNYEQPKSGCQLITVGAKAPCLLG